MRPKLARILVAVAAVVLLYFMLRAGTPSRQQSSGDVAQDTMCLASRIGLPCRPD